MDESKRIEEAAQKMVREVELTTSVLSSMREEMKASAQRNAELNKEQANLSSIMNRIRSPLLRSVAMYSAQNASMKRRIETTEREIAYQRQKIDVMRAEMPALRARKAAIDDEIAQHSLLARIVGMEIAQRKRSIASNTTDTATKQQLVDRLSGQHRDASARVHDLQQQRAEIIRNIATEQSVVNSELEKHPILPARQMKSRTGKNMGVTIPAGHDQAIKNAIESKLNALNQSLGDVDTRISSEAQGANAILGELDANRAGLNSLLATGTDLSDAQRDAETRLQALIDMMGFLGRRGIRTEAELAAFNKAIAETEEKITFLGVQLDRKKLEALQTRISSMANVLAAASRAIVALTDSVRKTQQQFGVVAGQAVQLTLTDLFESIKSTLGALVGLGPRVSRQQIAGARGAFQDEFGGLLETGAAKSIAARAVEQGITVAQMAQAHRVFMTQSRGDFTRANELNSKFVSAFGAKGLTPKDAMEAIAKHAELFARSGARFGNSFTRAAADAKIIAVELSKVSQVGDNIIGNFEGFLESQAELGALGFGMDTSRLAELAESGDDGAFFNELRSQLAMSGKDLHNLRRSERLAIEQAFGIPISELQRMGDKTTGSGLAQKSVEEETKDLTTKIFNALEALAVPMWTAVGALGVANGLLFWIAMNTRATASASSLLSGGLRFLAGGLAASGLGIGSYLAHKKAKELADSGNVGGARNMSLLGSTLGGSSGGTVAGMLLGLKYGKFAGPKGALLGAAAGAVIGTGYGMVRPKYHTGGVVGKKQPLASDEVPAILQRGEAVLSRLQFAGLNRLVSGVNSLGGIGNMLKGITDNIGRSGNQLLGATANMVRTFSVPNLMKSFGSVGNMVSGIKNVLSSKIGGFVGSITGGGSNILGGIGKMLSGGIGGKISSLFGGGSIGKLLGGGKAALGNIFGGSGAISGIAGKLGGIFGGGGLTNILGMAGGPLGMLAGPLLSKLPGISNVMGGLSKGVGSVVGGIGSAIGSIFGRKKKKPAPVQTSIANQADFSQLLPMMAANPALMFGGMKAPMWGGSSSQQSSPNITNNVNVDMTKLEQKLDQVVAAIRGMQIHMDGNKVGSVLVGNSQSSSVGILNP